eukprot:4355321-Pyramimonas_sp.AAC.1
MNRMRLISISVKRQSVHNTSTAHKFSTCSVPSLWQWRRVRGDYPYIPGSAVAFLWRIPPRMKCNTAQ